MGDTQKKLFVSVTDRTTSLSQTMETTTEHLNHHLSGKCTLCKSVELVHLGHSLISGESANAIARADNCGVFSYKLEPGATATQFGTKVAIIAGNKQRKCVCGNHPHLELMVSTKDAVYKVPGFLCPLFRTKPFFAKIRLRPGLTFHNRDHNHVILDCFQDVYPSQTDIDLFVPRKFEKTVMNSSREGWEHPFVPPGSAPHMVIPNCKMLEVDSVRTLNVELGNRGTHITMFRNRSKKLERTLLDVFENEQNLTEETKNAIRVAIGDARFDIAMKERHPQVAVESDQVIVEEEQVEENTVSDEGTSASVKVLTVTPAVEIPKETVPTVEEVPVTKTVVKRVGWLPVEKWEAPIMKIPMQPEVVQPPAQWKRPKGKFRKLNASEELALTNFAISN